MRRVRRIAYACVAVLGVGALLYLFFKYIFSLILPFAVALGVAMAVRRPSQWLSSRTHLPERVWRIVLSLACVVGTLALFGVGVWTLSVELWRFFLDTGSGSAIGEVLSGGVLSRFGELIGDALGALVSSAVSALGSLVSAVVGMLPGAVLCLLVTVIATVYFAWDLDGISAAVKEMLPQRVADVVSRLKRGTASVALRYVRSLLVLMLLTFAVMLIGLAIIDVPYVLLISLILAVVDAFPVLGVGTVLLPWSIYELVLGMPPRGVALLVLYGVNTVIRQFAEPRIVGRNLGLHPTLTLIFVYVGYSLFGFVGLLIGPMVAVVLNVAIHKEDAADIAQPPAAEIDDS